MSTTLPQFGPGAELDHAATRSRRPTNPARVGIALAAVGLALVIGNIVLALLNQGLRTEVERRQHFIAASAPLGRIDNALILEIAKRAASNHDAALNTLLKNAGISYHLKQTPARKDAKP